MLDRNATARATPNSSSLVRAAHRSHGKNPGPGSHGRGGFLMRESLPLFRRCPRSRVLVMGAARFLLKRSVPPFDGDHSLPVMDLIHSGFRFCFVRQMKPPRRLNNSFLR